MNNMQPSIGHNNPPSDAEWLAENLTLKYVNHLRAYEEHADIVGRMPGEFTEESEAAYTADLIKMMKNGTKEIERLRKTEKEPFLRQGQLVDSFFKEYTDKLDQAIERANRPLNDWLQRKAEAERQQRERDAAALREEQMRALKEAANMDSSTLTQEERAKIVDHAVTMTAVANTAEAIAKAPLNAMARTEGKGSSAALAKKWIGTIKDINSLDLMTLRQFISASALQEALDRYVRQGGRKLEGAEIKEIIDVKVK